jgi:hypothetical protein
MESKMEPRLDREVCVKVLCDSEFAESYSKLKDWFKREGGWVFKGGDIITPSCKASYTPDMPEEEREGYKRKDFLNFAKEFVCSIDKALNEAYCVSTTGNEKKKEDGDNQRVIWAVKCSALIQKVKEQFNSKHENEDAEFCKKIAEDSIIQGNVHNAVLPRGIVPVPLYDYSSSDNSERKWLLIPYARYSSFMDNLAAALSVNQFKLIDCMEDKSLTARTSLQAEEFLSHANWSDYVVVKIVFLEKMRQSVLEYQGRVSNNI